MSRTHISPICLETINNLRVGMGVKNRETGHTGTITHIQIGNLLGPPVGIDTVVTLQLVDSTLETVYVWQIDLI